MRKIFLFWEKSKLCSGCWRCRRQVWRPRGPGGVAAEHQEELRRAEDGDRGDLNILVKVFLSTLPSRLWLPDLLNWDSNQGRGWAYGGQTLMNGVPTYNLNLDLKIDSWGFVSCHIIDIDVQGTWPSLLRPKLVWSWWISHQIISLTDDLFNIGTKEPPPTIRFFTTIELFVDHRRHDVTQW